MLKWQERENKGGYSLKLRGGLLSDALHPS
jgi:hypothetical protein